MVTLYLAGAIRDHHPEDVQWRDDLSLAVFPLMEIGLVKVLNPLGNSEYTPQTKKWVKGGIIQTPMGVVGQDFWCVDKADILVCNLLALDEDYPCIGTLMELGRSTSRSILRYLILPPSYMGHGNPGMFGLHPFLQQTSTHIFESVNDTIEFLKQHLMTLEGTYPFSSPEAVTKRVMKDQPLVNPSEGNA